MMKNPFVFLRAHAPWCGHCKALEPKWIELAKTIVEIKFADIDCPANPKICSRLGIRGYPTLQLFVNNYSYEFEYDREFEIMRSWVKKMIRPMFEAIPERDIVIAAEK